MLRRSTPLSIRWYNQRGISVQSGGGDVAPNNRRESQGQSAMSSMKDGEFFHARPVGRRERVLLKHWENEREDALAVLRQPYFVMMRK